MMCRGWGWEQGLCLPHTPREWGWEQGGYLLGGGGGGGVVLGSEAIPAKYPHGIYPCRYLGIVRVPTIVHVI